MPVGSIPPLVRYADPAPRRYPALSGRAAIRLAVLAGVAVGCGTIFYPGTHSAPNALTASITGITAPNALSAQLEHGAKAHATKRLLDSAAAVLDRTEELQISQFELAEAPPLKRNPEKSLDVSAAEYQSRLKDSQDALDAALRAKELASQALEAERHRAQAIQTQLDDLSQLLARLRADGSKLESRLEDRQGALDAAVQARELASQELRAERQRAQAIQTHLDETSRQLARLRADGSKFEGRLKDSQGALDAALRAKELASRNLEAERRRVQTIQIQLEEASRQLARLRADGSQFEVETRQLRDAMTRLGDALPSSTRAGETARGQLETAQSTEQALRERLRASERESKELELRAKMAILEMDKEAARLRAEQAAETARAALAAARGNQFRPRDEPPAGEPETADAPGREAAKEATRDLTRVLPGPTTEVASKSPPDAKVKEETLGATPRAAYDRPLPQQQLTWSKKWISVAAIRKAKGERQRQAAEAAARKAEEERLRVAAAEAAQKAEAERQHQAAEAAATARKAEEERRRVAAEAAQKAKAEREHQAAEAATAARKAEDERRRVAAEAAQKAKAERQRQAAEAAAAAARKAEEERLQVAAAKAAQKAEAERQRQAAEAAAAARKAEEERLRIAAAEAAQKAKAERQRQAAEAAAAAARKAEEERLQVAAAKSAQRAEAERQRQAAEAAAAARKAEEERLRIAAAEAAQKAKAEREHQAAEAATAARKAEDERRRVAAEAAQKAERQRQAAEAAAAARKAEEERLRVAAEAAQKGEAARIAKEAVEAKTRADQASRRRTLGLTVSSEDGARFLARGRALLTTGDVTSARLFLERASNAGLADAAMELAETYDPATVTRLSTVGLMGDREQARAWYLRAQALGSSTAAERLKSIAGQ